MISPRASALSKSTRRQHPRRTIETREKQPPEQLLPSPQTASTSARIDRSNDGQEGRLESERPSRRAGRDRRLAPASAVDLAVLGQDHATARTLPTQRRGRRARERSANAWVGSYSLR